MKDATETYWAWRCAPLRFASARVQQTIKEEECTHNTIGIYQVKEVKNRISISEQIGCKRAYTFWWSKESKSLFFREIIMKVDQQSGGIFGQFFLDKILWPIT